MAAVAADARVPVVSSVAVGVPASAVVCRPSPPGALHRGREDAPGRARSEVVAAISISVPTSRWDQKSDTAWAELVVEGATRLSRQLGAT
jgi:hypothetical protein